MPIAGLVADANVLLSAVVGKAALRVFRDFEIPVHTTVFNHDYEDWLPWAQETLAERDPDDAHPLALARTLNLPLWSNDRDLQVPQVRCYTTAALLKALES